MGHAAGIGAGGKETSTRVPSCSLLLIVKEARLASTKALVKGRPKPVPLDRLALARRRNGSKAAPISASDIPLPVSRIRMTAFPASARAVETITWPHG